MRCLAHDRPGDYERAWRQARGPLDAAAEDVGFESSVEELDGDGWEQGVDDNDDADDGGEPGKDGDEANDDDGDSEADDIEVDDGGDGDVDDDVDVGGG